LANLSRKDIAKVCAIAGADDLGRGVMAKAPNRIENRREHRFQMPRRHVDNNASKVSGMTSQENLLEQTEIGRVCPIMTVVQLPKTHFAKESEIRSEGRVKLVVCEIWLHNDDVI
jgi:hypothetical protein